MKKVMVLSLVFLFYFNAPAHAGWISTATKAGKVAKKAVIRVLTEAQSAAILSED